jgi:hypothetical protein
VKSTSRDGHKRCLEFVFVAQGASVGPFQISRCPASGRLSFVALAAFVAVVLSGCSAAPIIDIHAADYRETEATAGDAQLLQNILRAKDNLPIHFADLSNIHGSI